VNATTDHHMFELACLNEMPDLSILKPDSHSEFFGSFQALIISTHASFSRDESAKRANCAKGHAADLMQVRHLLIVIMVG